MNPRHGSMLHVILVAALVAVAPLALYFGAYFGLSCSTTRSPAGSVYRVYHSPSMALIFFPACLVESAITGRETLPAWRDPAIGPRPNGS
jgi:hypothetical protein